MLIILNLEDQDYFYKVDFEAIQEDIETLSDIEKLREKISKCLSDYLEPIEYVLDIMSNDKYKTKLVSYVDDYLYRLTSYYSDDIINPFSWQDLDNSF